MTGPVLLAAILFSSPAGCDGGRSKTLQDVLDSVCRNQDAQTQYYTSLKGTVAEKPKRPWDRFVRNVAENPVAVFGVVGAVIAALVAVGNSYASIRASQRQQQDTQFYEALKRFGDKDSPALRASAVHLLTQMALIAVRTPKIDVGRFPLALIAPAALTLAVKYEESYPYLHTAIDQLLTGLRLENDPVVLDSIGEAISKCLLTLVRGDTADFREVENKLREVEGITGFDLAVRLLEENLLPPVGRITAGAWETASTKSSVALAPLQALWAQHSPTVKELSFEVLADGGVGAEDEGSQPSLRIVGQRYRIVNGQVAKLPEPIAEANAGFRSSLLHWVSCLIRFRRP